jgi:hypothetical protein
MLNGVDVKGLLEGKLDGAFVTGLSDVTTADIGKDVGIAPANKLGTFVGAEIGLMLGSTVLGTTLGTTFGASTDVTVGDKPGAVVEVDGTMFTGTVVDVATGMPDSFAFGRADGASVEGNKLGFNVGCFSLGVGEPVGGNVPSVLVVFLLHSLDSAPDESYTVIP